MKPTLRIAPATHDAARHACERWHYAGVLPTGKLVKLGVWEDERLVGVVVFSRGASPWLGVRYGRLAPTELCELTRVAMRAHLTPVSRVLSIAVRVLRKTNPGLRLVVSFADPEQGHHGGIYQAAGWVYTGTSEPVFEYRVGGRFRHVRGAWNTPEGAWTLDRLRAFALARGLDPAGDKFTLARRIEASVPNSPVRVRDGKHRYVYPLDPKLRTLVEASRLPYPKPAADPVEGRRRPAGGRRFDSDPAALVST